ncbi:MAG: dephospho-CoA kinase [Aggregatilineales bacterium]
MSQWSNKYVIGLTGNIATGKSVVRQMLQHSGAYTIDADALAHKAMMPGAPAYKPVVEAFGRFIVGGDGRINRQLLGQIVFSNPEALKRLEAITHPIIRQAISALVRGAKQRVIVIEAIKLLDGGLSEMVDSVWVVNAEPRTQYERLVKRRKMTEADAKQRILSQSAQADKVAKAAVVIQNNGNIEDTWKQVQRQWAEIRKLLTSGTSSAPAASAGSAARSSSSAQPAAAAPAEGIDAPSRTIAISGIKVSRGTPGSAGTIAEFISTVSGKEVSRMDVMMSFGEKSYMVAQNDDDSVLGIMGWTVENLVTRMDEFHLVAGATAEKIIHAMIIAVEEASQELQSEVAFFFLPTSTAANIVQAYQADGYQSIILKEIKVPAWREAVEEYTSESDNQVLWKQLRQDRVLQPI